MGSQTSRRFLYLTTYLGKMCLLYPQNSSLLLFLGDLFFYNTTFFFQGAILIKIYIYYTVKIQYKSTKIIYEQMICKLQQIIISDITVFLLPYYYLFVTRILPLFYSDQINLFYKKTTLMFPDCFFFTVWKQSFPLPGEC